MALAALLSTGFTNLCHWHGTRIPMLAQQALPMNLSPQFLMVGFSNSVFRLFHSSQIMFTVQTWKSWKIQTYVKKKIVPPLACEWNGDCFSMVLSGFLGQVSL